MSKLNEILIDYHKLCCLGCDKDLCDHTSQANDLIKLSVIDLIGEDEPLHYSGIDDGDYDDVAITRNLLRDELRTKVEAL